MLDLAVADVAQALRAAPEDLPWLHEAPCRALLRRTLCLSGEPWNKADRRALELLEQAARVVGLPDRQSIGWDEVSFNELAAGSRPPRVCLYCGEPNLRAPQSRYCSSAHKFMAMRRRLGRVQDPGRPAIEAW